MTVPSTDPQPLVKISGHQFDETVAFFTNTLGFSFEMITPADDPRRALLNLGGLRVLVDRDWAETPTFVLPRPDLLGSETPGDSLIAPNGCRVEFSAATEPFVPELIEELVISSPTGEDNWVIGRAGMRYRDLIPSRLGGRFIASNIEVCDGGPVPDRVHHHAIRFQMIFVTHGWVDVVYEDQGPPFRMQAGDGVLQPPHIRHRVLESSAGAQVVEIGCPAAHDTLFDDTLELPTGNVDASRDFGGQQFVRYVAADSPANEWRHEGWSAKDTGISSATNGLAGAWVVSATNSDAEWEPVAHGGEFQFVYVLDGSADLIVADMSDTSVGPGTAITVPADVSWAVRGATGNFSFLEVRLPG